MYKITQLATKIKAKLIYCSIFCILTIIGLILALFSNIIGAISLFIDLIVQITCIILQTCNNNIDDQYRIKTWLARPFVICVKIILLTLIIQHLFVNWFNIQYFEYSRGGAKFHFEDFKTSAEMQQYINMHYPVNSNPDKVIFDAETAGGICEYGGKDSEEFKRIYSGVDFDYYATWECEYWKKYRKPLLNCLFNNYCRKHTIRVFINDKNQIINIHAEFYNSCTFI